MEEQIGLFKADADWMENFGTLGYWSFGCLRKWAESFGLDWEEGSFGLYRSLEHVRGKKKMLVYLGRVFDIGIGEYLPAIHFDYWDDESLSGYAAAYSDIDECAKRIKMTAAKF